MPLPETGHKEHTYQQPMNATLSKRKEKFPFSKQLRNTYVNLRRKKSKAMTLIEVMVGTVLFAILGVTLTAGYIQNYRMAKLQTYRTQANSIAISILEQLRNTGYNGIVTTNYSTLTTFNGLNLLDLTQPTGYSPLVLNINVKDGTQINGTWTQINIPLDSSANSPQMPMRFWLTLNNNTSSLGYPINVMELALIYQWGHPGVPGATWSSSALRQAIINPNSNPYISNSNPNP